MLIREYRITLPMTVEEYQVYYVFNSLERLSLEAVKCRWHSCIQWQRPQKMRLVEAKGSRLEKI